MTTKVAGVLLWALFFILSTDARSDQKDPSAIALMEGTAAEKTANYDRALALYDKALGSEETREPALQGIVRILHIRNDFKTAEKELSRFIKKYPFSAEAHALLAKNYLRQKKYDLALKTLKYSDELRPESTANRPLRGEIYFEKGNIPEAIELLSQTLKDNPQNFEARVIRTRAYIEKKNIDLALQDAKILIDQKPHYHEGRLLMANLQYERGNHKEAEAIFLAIQKEYADNIKFNEKVGDVSEKLSKLPQAVEFYKKAMALDVKNLDVALKLVKVYLKQSQFDAAEKVFREQKVHAPKSRPLIYEFVKFLLDQKRPDLAAAELEKFTDAFPHELWALITYERLLLSINQLDRAEDLAKRGLKATKFAVEPYLYFGYVRHKHGDFRGAVKVMQDAELRYTKDNRVKFNHGLALEMLGEYDDAIAKYKEVQDDSNIGYKAKINLAILMEKMGKKDEAMRIMRELVLPKDRKVAQIESGKEGSITGFKPFREMELP